MGKADFTSDNDSNASTSSRRAGASAFLSAGRLSLYTENAFRVLGMTVDASDIELQERHGVLKTYASLKRIKEVYTIAWGLNPPPSGHRLDDALERLNDGEQRASDEFFWFWPRETGATDDAGLDAIAAADPDEALRVWREWEQEPGEHPRAIARHNLAVNYLILALEETARHLAGTLAANKEAQLKNAWKNAARRWAEAAGSSHIWDEMKKRILSKCDPALTTALADEMRAGLGKTLSAIHGDIARHYAEKGRLDWAKFHMDAMLGNAMLGDQAGFDDDYRATVREVTKPVRDSLEAARSRAQSHADATDDARKKQSFAQAKNFLENEFEKTAKPVLDLFYAGDSALEKEKHAIYDKVALTACNCCVAAFNSRQNAGEKTDDDSALMKKALEIATDPQLKERIKKNISHAAADPALAEITKTFADVAQGSASASTRYRKLGLVIQKLKTWAAKNPGHEQRATLLKAFAMLARQLSVEIFNKENNTVLAIAAIECAIALTPDDNDRKNFRNDLAKLKNQGKAGEFFKVIKEVGESSDAAIMRFGRLKDIRKQVHEWEDSQPESDHETRLFMKAFAGMERALSVAIFNQGAELAREKRGRGAMDTIQFSLSVALDAICCAVQDTPDDDDRKTYLKDYDQLAGIAKQAGVTIPARPGRRKRGSSKPLFKPSPSPKPTPTPASRPPKPRRPRVPWFAGRMVRAAWTGMTLFTMSFAFRHYYPDGLALPLVESLVLRWWHLAPAGAMLSLLFPLGGRRIALGTSFFFLWLWIWMVVVLLLTAFIMLVRAIFGADPVDWQLWAAPYGALACFLMTVIFRPRMFRNAINNYGGEEND